MSPQRDRILVLADADRIIEARPKTQAEEMQIILDFERQADSVIAVAFATPETLEEAQAWVRKMRPKLRRKEKWH